MKGGSADLIKPHHELQSSVSMADCMIVSLRARC